MRSCKASHTRVHAETSFRSQWYVPGAPLGALPQMERSALGQHDQTVLLCDASPRTCLMNRQTTGKLF